MSTVNRTHTQARDAQVIAGIQKHLQSASSLPLVGSTYTPADLVKLVQGRIDSANGSATAKANWRSSVVEDRTLNTKLTPVIRALRQHMINVFGVASPVLADFGFTPPKRATRTPEQKAASVAKAKATRAARHTMGKVQKKGVKGAVIGITVTPILAPQPTATEPSSPTTHATSTGPTAAAPPPGTTS
ncbi:MAG: hypothetical protein M3O46_02440 [Myxococcota bacterium]|nr:hypothetical protein [Myxococcota bacterium]